jgi:hypothetical protein
MLPLTPRNSRIFKPERTHEARHGYNRLSALEAHSGDLPVSAIDAAFLTCDVSLQGPVEHDAVLADAAVVSNRTDR